MQVVGRPCDLCQRAVKSELDGVACLQCERVFHDACVPVAATDTYRTARPPREGAKPKKKVRAPSQTICPTCGDDVRALKRARDRADARARDGMRRVVDRRATSPTGLAAPSYVALRIGIAIVVAILSALARSLH